MITPRRLALLATTLVCALTAADAHAAPPGLNISAYSDATVALSKGAKQVRFFVRWSDFEPNDAAGMTALGPAAPTPLTDGLRSGVANVEAAGATPIMVILGAPGWAASGKRPRDPAEFAAFAGELAAWLAPQRSAGQASPVYEVWNEPDDILFWGEAPNAAFYTDMLKRSYTAIKAGDPGATVLTGPTTGNNYNWIESLYANGAKGAFDGVAVHTDTACLVAGPDEFYRENGGRIGQFTFLGYREVYKSMAAQGDGDKKIWMTELGWSSTNGNATSCASGVSKGKKPSGVNEADQAKFLTKAFQCLAQDDYVAAATVFTLRDDLKDPSGENHHGLLREDGSSKPVLKSFEGADKLGPAECGDFTPPAIKVLAPAEGQKFVDKLDLQASATDGGVGLARISYAYDKGQEIRNFTSALTNGSAVGLAPWQKSGALGLGPHTVEVTALDKNGNTSTKVVNVVKVAPGSLTSTFTPVYKLGKKVSCKGRSCTFKGTLSRGAGGRPSIGGKVAIEWQFKNKKGKFKKLVGGLKPASKGFTFKAKLKFKGQWRVRLVYKGQAPYKSATSKFVTFRVK